MPDCHCGPRRGRSQRGHRLPRASSAELSGEQGDQHDDEADRNGRQHPQSARVCTEHPLREAAKQRGESRLIVVAPSGMVSRDAEVQLVAVIAVPIRRRNEQQHRGKCDRKDKRPGDSRMLATHDQPTASRTFWISGSRTRPARKPEPVRSAATRASPMMRSHLLAPHRPAVHSIAGRAMAGGSRPARSQPAAAAVIGTPTTMRTSGTAGIRPR